MAEQAELTRPETGNKIQTVNPATEQPGKSYPETSIDDAHRSAAAAHQAFLKWRRTSFAERSAVIRKTAEVLRARKDEFARLMTDEMGKTLDRWPRRSREMRVPLRLVRGPCRRLSRRRAGRLRR